MGATRFVIMLPPSESKAEGGNTRAPWKPSSGVFGASLGGWRRDVSDALLSAGGGSAQLLGVKGVHLERAQRANSSLVGAPTLPAWQRYTGVVWDHLDLTTIPTAARTEAIRRIIVPSGLMGLVRADDPVPDYRLKMGARLAPFGSMASWWRDDLTDALLEHVRGRTVVDLLPQEHRGAIEWEHFDDLVRIDLLSRTGGVVGGHNAKAAKGLLARHLLTARTNDLAALVSSFRHADYRARIT